MGHEVIVEGAGFGWLIDTALNDDATDCSGSRPAHVRSITLAMDMCNRRCAGCGDLLKATCVQG